MLEGNTSGGTEEVEVLTGTGRGPTGRLRNFRAMNGEKLDAVHYAITGEENNDPEAIEAVTREYESRSS